MANENHDTFKVDGEARGDTGTSQAQVDKATEAFDGMSLRAGNSMSNTPNAPTKAPRWARGRHSHNFSTTHKFNGQSKPKVKTNKDLICPICNVNGHDKSECFMTNPAKVASFIKRHPEQRDYWEQRVAKYNDKKEETGEKKETRNDPRLCFQCGSNQHIRRGCPQILRECYLCGSKQHFTSDCVGGAEALNLPQ